MVAKTRLSGTFAARQRSASEVHDCGRYSSRSTNALPFAAYSTVQGRALVDRELYLPKCWTKDRERCREAKIPDERTFATKGELARDIVRRCLAAGLPAT
ncbi:hypothetical protein GCM10010344_00150 [Streptomyces bluensis]|uniref:transposase n=1 Tax=Streptomyces bluensis TaxID=33897 RepID=UPI0019A90798|nr:transposase [Streptomyces bluensis]GGZ39731.1 hypothetical protein GCM10010344_00150 [Streptomyces bluensis]